MIKSRKVDPDVAAARANLGNAIKYDPHGDHSEYQRNLIEANAAAYLKRMLTRCPPLTDAQRARLAELLTTQGEDSRTLLAPKHCRSVEVSR